MKRYVALLRGINVGGHRVKMDRLRALFSDMGFGDVRTFIASGNVIFTVDGGGASPQALERVIESGLAEALGYEVATFIREPAQLRTVVDRPAADLDDPDHSVYVTFLHAPPDEQLREALRALESDMDRFVFAGRELYWRVAGKMSESPLFGGGLTKALRGVPNTARNVTSLRKLLVKHPPDDAP